MDWPSVILAGATIHTRHPRRCGMRPKATLRSGRAPPQSWFPDAFAGTMGQLLCALEQGEAPVLHARDNLRTIALVEAALQSSIDHRVIEFGSFTKGTLL
jgi:predicted dehydrogenase